MSVGEGALKTQVLENACTENASTMQQLRTLNFFRHVMKYCMLRKRNFGKYFIFNVAVGGNVPQSNIPAGGSRQAGAPGSGLAAWWRRCQ